MSGQTTGELPADQVRELLRRAAEMAADYLIEVERYPVLPPTEPGELEALLPDEAPEHAEPLERILTDVEDLVLPRLTHWNHPGFLAYFGITGSAPGVAGELLAAATNVNAMLWRTSPAATELELKVCDWLRRLLGLPPSFSGHINDTASISTMLALAAARHRADPDVRRRGLTGRAGQPALRLYTSEQAHMSVDKAAVVLGIGLDNVRHIGCDAEFRMSVEALERAVEEDLEAGFRPLAVVATAGTTSTTSVDPLSELASLCQRRSLWLHVDAAYAGSAAICPETRPLFAGWEAADSIVVNPHKWLFTPLDCSVLLVRDPAELVAAFSIVPEYLAEDAGGETNLMDLGVQLGRRFRALKLWMVIRAYGAEGLRERLREHCRLARWVADRIVEDDRFELLMAPPFSTVCFRLRGTGDETETRNRRLLEAVNATGRQFLSSTRLGGRLVLRLTIGNIKTASQHVRAAWETLQGAADRVAGR